MFQEKVDSDTISFIVNVDGARLAHSREGRTGILTASKTNEKLARVVSIYNCGGACKASEDNKEGQKSI